MNDIDLFVGNLAEDPIAGRPVGPTLSAGLTRQLAAFRDADRFYYKNRPFSADIRAVFGDDLAFATATATVPLLAQIIQKNSGVELAGLPIDGSFHTTSTVY